jgi:hypothetical protein
MMTGQVCSSLTRIVVSRNRHDELVEALAAQMAQVKVGDPFDETSQMGPLVAERQRDRVLGLIAQGIEGGATLAAGGGRPADLDKGWFVEPTVFGNVDRHPLAPQPTRDGRGDPRVIFGDEDSHERQGRFTNSTLDQRRVTTCVQVRAREGPEFSGTAYGDLTNRSPQSIACRCTTTTTRQRRGSSSMIRAPAWKARCMSSSV